MDESEVEDQGQVRIMVNVKVTVKVSIPPEEGSTSAERCQGSFSPPGLG